MAIACPVDLDTRKLREEIQSIYARVAADPSRDFHFHRGPSYAAEFLGYDRDALASRLKSEVGEIVRRQRACGVDGVNDGEIGKTNFNNYVRERLAGFETRPYVPGKSPKPLSIAGRELEKFPDYFAAGGRGFGAFAGSGPSRPQVFCVAPLKYVGHAALKEDLENLRAALRGLKATRAFMSANTPGTIEHWLRNEHYPDEEAFVYAIAEAMREEYKAITDAGFILQIDDPRVVSGWDVPHPKTGQHLTMEEYRKEAELRVEALNHALRNVPAEQVRHHVCWAAGRGPTRSTSRSRTWSTSSSR